MSLQIADFSDFFEEVYGHAPFPWQERLLLQVAGSEGWPKGLNLPTGAGKTAAIDVAVFHLALEAERCAMRRAPVRIAFVIDRRLVVDDAFSRALKLEAALANPAGEASRRVAERLRSLSDEGPPLVVRRLRGGLPREDDWARTPSQPTVLCSTVDQVGSRLLFRGYGVSDSMKSIHAGLLGSDCLILLDEAHLAEPFRQTLDWVDNYRGTSWRESAEVAPWATVLLTATPSPDATTGFGLANEDLAHPVLQRRLNASKPVHLVAHQGSKGAVDGRASEPDMPDSDSGSRAAAIVAQVWKAFDHFRRPEHSAPTPAIGVVVNRVGRVRAVYEAFRQQCQNGSANGQPVDVLLMIGPARPIDRDDLAGALEPIRTRDWAEGEKRSLNRAVLVVSTQCIEAGVDIDLDGLITEAAPLDALRQRFGRLNRAGRNVRSYGAVLAMKSDLAARFEDPVYGRAIKPSWDLLTGAAIRKRGQQIIDFGLTAFPISIPSDVLAPKADAPVLSPAHLDLLSHTSPIPGADPDVALYLHGLRRQPDSIGVVWRADISPDVQSAEEVTRLLMLVPPRSSEAIELPIWAVRRWLTGGAEVDRLADVAGTEPDEDDRRGRHAPHGRVFRWKGNHERSVWLGPADGRSLRPGDTIIVPAPYGGLDEFGWHPEYAGPVTDLGQRAAAPFAGRRFAARVGPGLVPDGDVLAEALASAASRDWKEIRATLLSLPLPESLRLALKALDRARRGRVLAYLDLYGADDEGRPRGVVFVAPLGLETSELVQDQGYTTEDDIEGSLSGIPVPLAEHSRDVAATTARFAMSAGLPPARVADLQLAGELHDAGKADGRFQSWLHDGDPLGADPDRPDTILAKSSRRLPRGARALAGLPDRWRHEALSVRQAMKDPRLSKAADPDLVLWLVGTHHGYGRPLFPHCDPDEHPPDVGPQCLAFDWKGRDWPTLFTLLKGRYGAWELCRMEAILRLADHHASRAAASGGRR
jgi:CRISPR-associated endonuclease/helicase Cas3